MKGRRADRAHRSEAMRLDDVFCSRRSIKRRRGACATRRNGFGGARSSSDFRAAPGRRSGQCYRIPRRGRSEPAWWAAHRDETAAWTRDASTVKPRPSWPSSRRTARPPESRLKSMPRVRVPAEKQGLSGQSYLRKLLHEALDAKSAGLQAERRGELPIPGRYCVYRCSIITGHQRKDA